MLEGDEEGKCWVEGWGGVRGKVGMNGILWRMGGNPKKRAAGIRK